MDEIVITSAKRLPIGKFMGSLSNFSAPQLGSCVIDSIILDSGISKDLIDEIIMGEHRFRNANVAFAIGVIVLF